MQGKQGKTAYFPIFELNKKCHEPSKAEKCSARLGTLHFLITVPVQLFFNPNFVSVMI